MIQLLSSRWYVTSLGLHNSTARQDLLFICIDEETDCKWDKDFWLPNCLGCKDGSNLDQSFQLEGCHFSPISVSVLTIFCCPQCQVRQHSQLWPCRGFSPRVWEAGEVELEYSGAEPSERSTTRFKFEGEAGGGCVKHGWWTNLGAEGFQGHPYDGDLGRCLDGDRGLLALNTYPVIQFRRLEKFPPDLGSA